MAAQSPALADGRSGTRAFDDAARLPRALQRAAPAASRRLDDSPRLAAEPRTVRAAHRTARGRAAFRRRLSRVPGCGSAPFGLSVCRILPAGETRRDARVSALQAGRALESTGVSARRPRA